MIVSGLRKVKLVQNQEQIQYKIQGSDRKLIKVKNKSLKEDLQKKNLKEQLIMIQKQCLSGQYQLPYQDICQFQQGTKRTQSSSPSAILSSFQKNLINSPDLERNRVDNENHPKSFKIAQVQSSQSYSSYQRNSSNFSKHSRTENSKEKLKVIHSMKDQQNMAKVKFQNSINNKQRDSERFPLNLSKNRANRLINFNISTIQDSQFKQISLPKSFSSKARHLKTQNSLKKRLKIQEQKIIDQNNSFQQVQHQSYARSINNSFGPISSPPVLPQFSKPMMTPFQQYYNKNQEQKYFNSPNQLKLRPQTQHSPSTQQRPNSLSLNRSNKKPMHTFYHCDLKNFYKYNDTGYLTDRQVTLRQNAQRSAVQALDKMIDQEVEEPQQSKHQKSKSLGHFFKLDKLKQEVQRQRKRKHQLNVKDQNQTPKLIKYSNLKQFQLIPKQKTPNPSAEQPSSSTISKKKFNVFYKVDENQNILAKNHINDDSYHEREEQRIKSEFQERSSNPDSSRKNEEMEGQNSEQSLKESISHLKYMGGIQSCSESQQQIPQAFSKAKTVSNDYMLTQRKQSSKHIQKNKKSQWAQQFQFQIPSNLGKKKYHASSEISRNSSERSIKERDLSLYSNSQIHQSQINKSIQFEDQSVLGLNSKQEINQYDSQNLDIDSNYNKVVQDEYEIRKSDISDKGSQQLKINSPKNKQKLRKKWSNIDSQKSITFHENSITSQEDFSKLNQSSSSVNPDQNKMKVESLVHRKEKNSKLSKCGSQSSISINSIKKSSLQKWVRETQKLKEQSNVEINMKKKQNSEVIYNVSSLKLKIASKCNSSGIKSSINQLQQYSDDSQFLQLDSAINLKKNPTPRQHKLNDSKLQKHTLSNKTSKISIGLNSKHINSHLNNEKNHSQLSLGNQSRLKTSSKKSQPHSQELLLEESQQELKMESKISNQMKRSGQSNQRPDFRSHGSSPSQKSSRKIKISMKNVQKGGKYGNLLTVHKTQKEILSPKSYTSSKVKSISDIGKVSKSKDSQSIYSSQKPQANSFKVDQFNLIQKIEKLLDIEDDLHQKRRKLENQSQINDKFQEVLTKIESHINTIRQILYIATSSMEIYSHQSTWMLKSCLYSLKKYQLQRFKIVESLKGKKSCFKIAENQLAEQDLKQFLNRQELKQLAKDIQHCNQLNQDLIQEYAEYIKQSWGQNILESEFSSKLFDDRYDLGVLLQEYRTEIFGLRDKKAEQHEDDSEVLEEAEGVINERIFKLMEAGFLLSQLAGKRVKEFSVEINYKEDFEEYFNDYWSYFQRIVKTFA